MTARRGYLSNVRAGAAFEELILAAVAHRADVQLMRGNPATKVLPDRRGGSRIIFVAKNGVDLVGIAFGQAVALECKRLPDAASLRATKDDSTPFEARFLHDFSVAGGRSAFLVLDDENRRLYVVPGTRALDVIREGVPLRDRDGTPRVVCIQIPSTPSGPSAAAFEAVALVAKGLAPDDAYTILPPSIS